MDLSEFALKLTGKSYFTCVGVWTPKLRNYIRDMVQLRAQASHPWPAGPHPNDAQG